MLCTSGGPALQALGTWVRAHTSPSHACRPGPLPLLLAGSHILSVSQMTPTPCLLSGVYEVKARSNCPTWANASPTLQLALQVAGVSDLAVAAELCNWPCSSQAGSCALAPWSGQAPNSALLTCHTAACRPCPPPQDCSIDILPMTDPALTCSEPLNDLYGENQMRAYYADLLTINSVLPKVENPARCAVQTLVQIQQSGCKQLAPAALLLLLPCLPGRADLAPFPPPARYCRCSAPLLPPLCSCSDMPCSKYMFDIVNSGSTLTMTFWSATTDVTAFTTLQAHVRRERRPAQGRPAQGRVAQGRAVRGREGNGAAACKW